MTTPHANTLDLAPLSDLTLASGSHPDRSNGLCVMEVAAWLAGEPHSDHPACVSPVIGALLRRWNDGLPDDESRTRLLKPLLVPILNTAGSVAQEERRAWVVLDWLVRTHTPAWFDLVPALSEAGQALRNLPALTDGPGTAAALPTIREASKQSAAAGAAARAAAWAAARAAAGDAARAAAGAAARDTLQPTTERLQESAVELVRALCAIGEAA